MTSSRNKDSTAKELGFYGFALDPFSPGDDRRTCRLCFDVRARRGDGPGMRQVRVEWLKFTGTQAEMEKRVLDLNWQVPVPKPAKGEIVHTEVGS